MFCNSLRSNKDIVVVVAVVLVVAVLVLVISDYFGLLSVYCNSIVTVYSSRVRFYPIRAGLFWAPECVLRAGRHPHPLSSHCICLRRAVNEGRFVGAFNNTTHVRCTHNNHTNNNVLPSDRQSDYLFS